LEFAYNKEENPMDNKRIEKKSLPKFIIIAGGDRLCPPCLFEVLSK
jgi:hypothetical protein